MMKILFVNTNIGYGGASKMMAFVANTIAAMHDVSVLVYRSAEIKQELYDNVKVIYDVLYQNNNKILEVVGQVFKLHKIIKTSKYDLVISFLPPSNYMIVLASILTKAKILLSERGDPISRRKKGGAFVHIVEHIIHRADVYVFQSEEAANAYPVKCRKKGYIITNAIPKYDFPLYNPIEEKYIACVARIELIQKRQDILLKAFRLFLDKEQNYKLYIIGDGPDEKIVKELAISLGIIDKVLFLGECHDVYQRMANSEFVVLSSDYEGVPNVLLEALAIGVPIITTDFSPGGAKMIIDDGINGFIVPCADPEKLADKMVLLAESDSLRKEFNKNSVNKVKQFNPDTIALKWLNVIHVLELNNGKA